MNWIIEHKGIVIVIIVLIVISIFISMVKYFINNTKRKINRVINRTLNKAVNKAVKQTIGIGITDASQLISLAKDISQEPEKRSVSGETNVYLPKITKDFIDFHNAEVLSAINVFINEYLDIKYKEKTHFEHSNTEKGLEEIIQHSEVKGKPHNITIHKTAISAYEKTNEYATITYQSAVGYNINNTRKEKRYKIEYTLKLSENGICEKILECDNCGASISSTAIETCPYCDARIIRDTRMSWKFTSITEC